MKTHAWQRSVSAWMFFPVLYLVVVSDANPFWLIPSFILYLTIALTVTIGYHRLFNHNSFECSRMWHWFFGLVGSISLNSSPVQWSAAHSAHHKYADTPNDPYDTNWRHFVRFKDSRNIKATRNEIRMLRDKMHVFLVKHSLSMSLAYGISLLAFNFNAFLYLYALPITVYLITSGLHTIFAHAGIKKYSIGGTTARNVWLMEFIIPMGGEWLHREHHLYPKLVSWNTKPHYFDLGGMLIRGISK
jgi:fatty-acid desaturase